MTSVGVRRLESAFFMFDADQTLGNSLQQPSGEDVLAIGECGALPAHQKLEELTDSSGDRRSPEEQPGPAGLRRAAPVERKPGGKGERQPEHQASGNPEQPSPVPVMDAFERHMVPDPGIERDRHSQRDDRPDGS